MRKNRYFKTNKLGQCSDNTRTVFNLLQLFSNTSPELGQSSSSVRAEIGTNRDESGRKIGVNRCKSVHFPTKVRVNEDQVSAKCVQKVEVNRGEIGIEKCYQLRPNATRFKGSLDITWLFIYVVLLKELL